MNTSEQKSALNSALTKEVATTTISKADVATTHLFSGEGPKVRACSLMSLSGPVGKRFFEPTVKELCSFERAALAKQTGSRMQSNSLSVKVSNTHMKSRLASSSVKRSRSNEDLKPHVRTIVRGKSSSDLLEKVILKRSQATKFKCYGNVTQDSLDEVNSNTPKCLLKSDLRSSCSPSPKKKKTANKADAELPTELKKKLDSKKRMLPMGKMISVTPSPATSNEVARNENKFFPTAICSSRLPILLDRKSQWEKVAMKSRSMFLKQRSQKMLKERLKKYRLVTPKSNVNNSETLAVEKETPVPYSTTKQTLPKFNQMNIFSHNDIEDDAEMEVKKEVELLVEKAMREAATNSFRTNRDSKKSVDNSVEKDSDVARDDAKAELYALFNESSQVTKRLDEVRLFKNYLLNNSAWKMARQ
ncbi:unnamed protein product [Litomosoides sigmodontis]|uniref:Uncharacterized protein n=1 Tax=Litomosoides sigmodontis TaxID=42156 RepID=A0A3P6UST3_LITSI|nr:unnamed protein product [Litomosoides sigmodontis]